MTLHTAWACLIVLPLCAVANGQPGQPTAEDIARAIRARGAAAVLADLHSRSGQWARVHRGIASGDASWMQVGRELAVGADAGWAELINLAFGEALVAAPALVLKMAPDLVATCGNIDDPFTSSLSKAQGEVRKREKAVRSVQSPALAKSRARCLEALAHLKGALPGGYE